MRNVKKYVLILTAAALLTAAYTKNVWAEDALPGEPVSGPAITEGEKTADPASGSAITPVKKPTPKISYTKLQLKVGKTKKIAVSRFDGKVKWSSSKKEIAKVAKDGVVTAKAPGDAVIIAQAGEKQLKCRVRVVAQTKHISEWFEKKGRVFYYNKYGVKVVGRKNIDGKDYYFDSDGRQRVGWVKIKKNYYYYNIGKGKRGYRVTGTVINGIRLKKTGEANLTANNRNKVRYLADANEICFDHVNFDMTRKEALKKMYTLMAKGQIISYYNYGPFKNSKNWDQHYASYYFERGIGDCYTAGCAFAYIATALGCKEVYAESSGGHGWCRIGERYYDPNWGFWGTRNIYDGFASKGVQKGSAGTMNWKRSCRYSKKVS